MAVVNVAGSEAAGEGEDMSQEQAGRERAVGGIERQV